MAALTDASAANLSSLVKEVEKDGRKILLTGDARSDRFMEAMGGGSHSYDVIKIPHHGSDRNVDGIFFRDVVAETYVFSGDGKHGNPERATIEMLLDNRPAATTPALVFTYSLGSIDTMREKEWAKKQRRRQQDGKPTTPWNDSDMSLTALHAERGDEFVLIEPNDAGLLPLV